MKKVKGFNYDTVKHEKIMNHINSQPNISKYILNLVEKDMKGSSIEEIVRQQIEKYLQGLEITKKENSVSINTEEVMDILRL